jgi:hypothetical protein
MSWQTFKFGVAHGIATFKFGVTIEKRKKERKNEQF